MQYLYSYLSSGKTIIEEYKGEIPFTHFLKNFFSLHKKYGSKDRKMIASLCYNYFRIANNFSKDEVEKALLTGVYLFTNAPNDLFINYNQAWNNNINLPIEQKAELAGVSLNKLFPFNHELSAEIDKVQFNFSLLQQPDLFIRIRPGKEILVKQKLDAAAVPLHKISAQCIAIANGTKLEHILEINNEAVIQDLNSQNVGDLFKLIQLPAKPRIWDCCAASGGKSIMAYDYFDDIFLTVSDIRPSIIYNLKKRFSEAGLNRYKSFVADTTNPDLLKNQIGEEKFDLIICDAPCSGSGTWARTPEQMHFFDEMKIADYSNLQKKIAANLNSYLSPNGYLLYVTCSVFKKENEDVTSFILQNNNLTLVKQELLKGYCNKADTMFVALFRAAK